MLQVCLACHITFNDDTDYEGIDPKWDMWHRPYPPLYPPPLINYNKDELMAKYKEAIEIERQKKLDNMIA